MTNAEDLRDPAYLDMPILWSGVGAHQIKLSPKAAAEVAKMVD